MNDEKCVKSDRELSDFENVETTATRVLKVAVNTKDNIENTFNLIYNCRGTACVEEIESDNSKDAYSDNRITEVEVTLRKIEQELDMINFTNQRIFKLFDYEGSHKQNKRF
jgi:C4-type Zn-finger protein